MARLKNTDPVDVVHAADAAMDRRRDRVVRWDPGGGHPSPCLSSISL